MNKQNRKRGYGQKRKKSNCNCNCEVTDYKTEDSKIIEMIATLIDITQRSEDDVCCALHECNNNVERALDFLLDTLPVGAFKTISWKKRNRTTNNVSDSKSGDRVRKGKCGETVPQGMVSKDSSRNYSRKPENTQKVSTWKRSTATNTDDQMKQLYLTTHNWDDWDNKKYFGSIKNNLETQSLSAISDLSSFPGLEQQDLVMVNQSRIATNDLVQQYSTGCSTIVVTSTTTESAAHSEQFADIHLVNVSPETSVESKAILNTLPSQVLNPQAIVNSHQKSSVQYKAAHTSNSAFDDQNVTYKPLVKRNKGKIPSPSKIPTSAVEMPEDTLNNTYLDMQFGCQDFVAGQFLDTLSEKINASTIDDQQNIQTHQVSNDFQPKSSQQILLNSDASSSVSSVASSSIATNSMSLPSSSLGNTKVVDSTAENTDSISRVVEQLIQPCYQQPASYSHEDIQMMQQGMSHATQDYDINYSPTNLRAASVYNTNLGSSVSSTMSQSQQAGSNRSMFNVSCTYVHGENIVHCRYMYGTPSIYLQQMPVTGATSVNLPTSQFVMPPYNSGYQTTSYDALSQATQDYSKGQCTGNRVDQQSKTQAVINPLQATSASGITSLMYRNRHLVSNEDNCYEKQSFNFESPSPFNLPDDLSHQPMPISVINNVNIHPTLHHDTITAVPDKVDSQVAKETKV